MDRKGIVGIVGMLVVLLSTVVFFNARVSDEQKSLVGFERKSAEAEAEAEVAERVGDAGMEQSNLASPILVATDRYGFTENLSSGEGRSFDGSQVLQVDVDILEGSSWPIRTERVVSPESGVPALSREMVADRLLVTLRTSETYDRFVGLLEEQGAQVVDRIGKDQLTFLISFSDFHLRERLPALRDFLLSQDGLAYSVEPDFIYRASLVPNEAIFPTQYAMHSPDDRDSYLRADINATDGWDLRTSAENQLIAVIDSGVQLSHPDLLPNLWVNAGEALDGTDSDGNGYVDDLLGLDVLSPGQSPLDLTGHGTAVAGLIGSVGNNSTGIAGLAWATRILPIRFIDSNNLGTASDAVKAIDYAAAQGATIINASWGGASKSLVLERAIGRATEAGILFVAAAGNEGWDIDETSVYPACFDNEAILVVGSVSNQGELSRFSNYGVNSVDIVAPGERVKSLSLEDNERVGTFTGTSFAAPLVSGIAALAREHFDETDPVALKNRILLGARVRQIGYSELDWVLARGYADLGRVLTEKTNVPANDNFAAAIDLGLTNASYSGSGRYASLESGEPSVGEEVDRRSVWFRLSDVSQSEFSINVRGVGLNHATAVYEGTSVDGLVEVGSWTDPTTGGIRWSGSLEGSGPYYLRVASEALGWYQVDLVIKPINDDFEHAVLLDEIPFVSVTNNKYANAENFEPRPSSGNRYDSVWWKLELESSVSAYLDTEGSSVDTILSIYKGETLQELELVARNDDVGSGSVTSGLTLETSEDESYYVQVLSKFGGGRIVLNGVVLAAPRITSQPKHVTVPLGARTSLRVVVVGAEPIEYQWYRDKSLLQGETSQILTIESVSEGSLGDYHVVVTTPYGSVTSDVASVSLLGAVPLLVEQPKSWDYLTGQTVRLSVVPLNGEGLSYQWYRGEELITGATSRVLEITNASASNSGDYYVVASNLYGTTKSEAASVFVASSEYELVARTSFDESYYDLIGGVKIGSGVMWYANAASTLLQSSDGFSWNPFELLIDGEPPRSTIRDILYGNDRFVVASFTFVASGPSLQALSESVSMPSRLQLMTFHDGYFYGLASDSIYKSSDGDTWVEVESPVWEYKDIVGEDGLWGYFGSGGLVYTTDFEVWTLEEFQTNMGHIQGYTFDNGKFLAVDHYGDIYRTTDAKSFEKIGSVPINSAENIYAFSKFGDRYVIATSQNLYYATSLDEWKYRANGSNYIENLYVVGSNMMGDGPSLSPHRLFHDGLPQDSKPVIVPVDWVSHVEARVGTPISLVVTVSEGDSPLASVNFLIDGQVVESRGLQPEYRFEWTSHNRGSYVARVEAVTESGERSTLDAYIEVIEETFKTVYDRNSLLSRIQTMETFKGSVFAVGNRGNLFRGDGLDEWLDVHTFNVGQIWDMFEMSGELWIHGEEAIMVSRDGLVWKELVRLGQYDRFVRGRDVVAWVKRSEGDLPSAARVFYESTSFVDVNGEFDRFEGIVLGSLYGYFIDNPYQLEILESGKPLERYSLPENGIARSVTEDGEYAYFLFDENLLYRTRDFVEWEPIDLQPLESENEGRTVRSITFKDGLFITDSGFVSDDLERWYYPLSDTIEEIEPDPDGGYFLVNYTGLYHISDFGKSRKLSDLPISAIGGGFLKTASGFYVWGGWTNEVWYSEAGLEWVRIAEKSEDYLPFRDMAYGNGRYIAVGDGQVVSTNGQDWELRAFWSQPFAEIEFGNGVFVACAGSPYNSNEYVYSFDGENWIRATLPGTSSVQGELVFSRSLSSFFLATNADEVFRSEDGIVWEKVGNLQGLRELRAVGDFLYLKDGVGRDYYSADGSEWIRTDESAYVYLEGRYYGGEWRLMVSEDGFTWEEQGRLNEVSASTAIPFRDGLLVNGGPDGKYFHYDGIEWHQLFTLPASGFLKNVNGKTFSLSDKIELFTDSDLAVHDASLVSSAGAYLVGDFVDIEFTVENVGKSALSLDSVVVEGRLLAGEQRWNDQDGYALVRGNVGDLDLETGATKVVSVSLAVPNGTVPGNYGIAILVNPTLLSETTLANNYTWIDGGSVGIPSVNLSVSIEGNGRAEIDPKRTVFAKGDTVLVRALPDPKNEYVGWSGRSVAGENIVAVDLERDTSITLRFEPIRYTVDWEAKGEGMVTFPDGQKESYLVGEPVRLLAEPDEGWGFVEWRGSFESSDSELALYVSEPVSLTAIFGQRFEAWRLDSFTEEQMLSESIVGKFANPDGDSLSNILEYLVGSDPNDPTDERRPSYRVEGGLLIASFPVSLLTLGYTPKLEVYEGGGTWSERSGEFREEGDRGELRLAVEIVDGVRLVRLRFEEESGEAALD